ncbi:MAG: HPF/RaiA family ribosome-associated protein [Gammaproteobacteria bacterium]|nr:HPF/RaiA family ribosome-associated protein [Gammaproteobacteria bacterium]
MQTIIQARDFSLTEALRNHAERRLQFALSCCSEYIRQVEVRLSDINGPRGGPDKRCHIHILLDGLPDVVIEDTESDMYFAIDRATERAGRTIKRKIERRQALSRQSAAAVPLADQTD